MSRQASRTCTVFPCGSVCPSHEQTLVITGTVGKRLSSIGVANEEQNRQALRQMLFQAPDVEKYISGVVSVQNYS